jgi:hypothetical protein
MPESRGASSPPLPNGAEEVMSVWTVFEARDLPRLRFSARNPLCHDLGPPLLCVTQQMRTSRAKLPTRRSICAIHRHLQKSLNWRIHDPDSCSELNDARDGARGRMAAILGRTYAPIGVRLPRGLGAVSFMFHRSLGHPFLAPPQGAGSLAHRSTIHANTQLH